MFRFCVHNCVPARPAEFLELFSPRQGRVVRKYLLGIELCGINKNGRTLSGSFGILDHRIGKGGWKDPRTECADQSRESSAGERCEPREHCRPLSPFNK